MYYPTIDIFKFICAVLIVCMHTYCRDLGNGGQLFVDTICTIGVPFFFIASGFFYAKGLLRQNIFAKRNNFQKYFKRIAKMYLAWSVITLPIAVLIIQRVHPDYSLFLKFIYLIRLTLLVGSIGIYWYLLALVYNCAIIYYVDKKRVVNIAFIVAVLMWVYGVMYNSPYNNGNLFFEFTHVVFSSERNFLMVGLFYMLIGYYFQKYESKLNISAKAIGLLLLLFTIIRVFEVIYLKTSTMQSLQAICLFMFALKYKFNLEKNITYKMRELSIAIYLMHFPFILLFDFYLKRGSIVDFSATILFCFISFYILKRYLKEKHYKLLFG